MTLLPYLIIYIIYSLKKKNCAKLRFLFFIWEWTPQTHKWYFFYPSNLLWIKSGKLYVKFCQDRPITIKILPLFLCRRSAAPVFWKAWCRNTCIKHKLSSLNLPENETRACEEPDDSGGGESPGSASAGRLVRKPACAGEATRWSVTGWEDFTPERLPHSTSTLHTLFCFIFFYFFFLQLTTNLEATPSWPWRICSNRSSKPTTPRPNGSMVSNLGHRLYLLEAAGDESLKHPSEPRTL